MLEIFPLTFSGTTSCAFGAGFTSVAGGLGSSGGGGAASGGFSRAPPRLRPDGGAGFRTLGFGARAFGGGAGFGGGGGGGGGGAFRCVSSCSTRTGAFAAISLRTRGTLGGAGGRVCAFRANSVYFVSFFIGGGAVGLATGSGAFVSAGFTSGSFFATGSITTCSATATGGASCGFGGGAISMGAGGGGGAGVTGSTTGGGGGGGVGRTT